MLVARGIPIALLLCACGSGTQAATSPPRSTAAAQRFTAPAFSAAVPQGWSDHTHDPAAVTAVNAGGDVQMLLLAPPTASSVGNEHIDVTTVAQPVPDDQLASYLQSVAQGGASNLSPAQPFNLDGATGIFITYNLMSSNNVTLKSQDMIVNHGGSTYDIVLNTAGADFDAQVTALQQVLSTWRWS